MKKIFIILSAAGLFLLGMSAGKKSSVAVIDNKTVTQVGIIVEDIEESAEAWTEFLGMESMPEISIAAGHESKPTHYQGKPSDAKAKLAFFRMENLTIELIEPLGGNSTWQEFLDTNGPGIHHIAFNVSDMDVSEENFSKLGIQQVQSGGWGTGEYAYMDASNKLSLIIELLENYNR